jgi:hypothetical protein
VGQAAACAGAEGGLTGAEGFVWPVAATPESKVAASKSRGTRKYIERLLKALDSSTTQPSRDCQAKVKRRRSLPSLHRDKIEAYSMRRRNAIPVDMMSGCAGGQPGCVFAGKGWLAAHQLSS